MAEFVKEQDFTWQQTMLRIKDPQRTVQWYEEHLGFRLIMKYDFPQWNFSLYFMGTLPVGETIPEPGTKEAEEYLWKMRGTCIEFTHNHGSETDDTFAVNNGNVEPHRGFGHIAVMTPDVYAASAELEQNGCKFQKRPDEGKMKGLAFVLDPDGYWVEIIKRNPESPIKNKFTFAQTMLRIKDPKKSLHFYCDLMGMTKISESHLGVGQSWGFSLYFLATVPKGDEEKCKEEGYIGKHLFGPVLELTHNHGTENQSDFAYHNGNDKDKGQIQGFGHTGFLCNDLEKACEKLEAAGVAFKKKPKDGNMHTLAFAYDPDNYWVEIIQRDGPRFI